jgi:hypothetical protein
MSSQLPIFNKRLSVRVVIILKQFLALFSVAFLHQFVAESLRNHRSSFVVKE